MKTRAAQLLTALHSLPAFQEALDLPRQTPPKKTPMNELPSSDFVRMQIIMLRNHWRLTLTTERACLALANYKLALIEDEIDECIEALDGFDWIAGVKS